MKLFNFKAFGKNEDCCSLLKTITAFKKRMFTFFVKKQKEEIHSTSKQKHFLSAKNEQKKKRKQLSKEKPNKETVLQSVEKSVKKRQSNFLMFLSLFLKKVQKFFESDF